eukprot:CAMPEP_0203665582 /NCGR_PEP_ID=MMETSP0090-20130426/2783_1 /ASSEMBLY_ACC=CAM_ASM_001088 /TAXON_ID=426623 /ORGANISM="Chaetoceros affinis, Strain CCMP159" /LENGTH=443 /DNA_ID=CAMNT_0050529191 /DNA_START=1 /DNA_END=1335 /DNA_ORIENTATION=+
MSNDKVKSKKRKVSASTDRADEVNGSTESSSKSFQNQTAGQPGTAVQAIKDVTRTCTRADGKDGTSTEKCNQEEGHSEAPKKKASPYDKIRHVIVINDGNHENLVRLIGLKNLFAKQLPKMPKDYIVRLVFDRRHKSLAILSDDPAVKGTDEEIIGAICYRPYHEMRFGEIAFCAVNGSQQVKGYGTKLMCLLKQHAVTEGVEYFITYADNYAIGYFKKQGFTKTITMSKSRFHGLIKDYDGGTLMECYVHPSIDYYRVPDMIKAQKEFILDRIRLTSKSDKVVYPPLPKEWKANTGSGLSSRGNEAAFRAMAIPGVAEAGWTMADLLASTTAAKDSDRQRNHLKSELLSIVRKTEDQQCAWPFREPVDTTEVTDYLNVIKDPIDLSTIEKRIRKGDWYKSKEMLHVDMLRMVNNCKIYNDPSSPYYECAESLEKFLKEIFPP